jgi:N-acetylglutamate synthase-like GNAT family acetyltransferase/SAM-dependent methyltransferase
MKEAVRDRYAKHAVELPQSEVPPTLGLGDPVALAKLQPGETVLDLGSGPGRDLLEAARQVGVTGRAIGVDFTPEMIERARASAAEAGLGNVAILNGELEGLPVHCGAVDVVISNCVINLVDDKRAALVETYRALRPGGRLAVLDTAFEAEPGPAVRESNDAWCACVGGSLVASDYEALLTDIGFENVSLEFIDGDCGESCSTDSIVAKSLAVTATKPGDSTPTLRPAVGSDRDAIESLLKTSSLPTDGLRIEDAIVALDGTTVVGAVALERFGTSALLRSLVVDEQARNKGLGRRLVIAALEVARWAKVAEIHLLTEDAQRFFTPFGFEAVSGTLVKEAAAESALVSGQCCTTATAMRLSFEEANLPLLSKPSIKPLPTFQDGACC